ncbi:S24/S26 family peptidase [Metabacillus idriensis]|uniref:S24/S26 family peptidase n=1 Tax=Metabacillus idriensis TaxID=324768 RepID=UPI001749188E|nr:S24/S26 family peptidase [Metabacillus idriensis]
MRFDHKTINLLKATIEKHGWIDLPAEGFSMYPFIQKGDICRFTKFNNKKFKKGDILLFYTTSGKMIAHRLYRYENGYFFLKGDTNERLDEPVSPAQVIGCLESVQKDKGIIHMNNPFAFLYSKAVVSTPFSARLFRLYINRKHGAA